MDFINIYKIDVDHFKKSYFKRKLMSYRDIYLKFISK